MSTDADGQTPLRLLPRPRRVERTGGQSTAASLPLLYTGTLPLEPEPRWRGLLAPARDGADATIRLRSDPERPPEGYRLLMRGDSSGHPWMTLDAGTPLGARHGLRTLAQLVRSHRVGSSATLPHLLIEDAPACPNRGVMLDVSRDRVPTMRELHDLVGLLASMKINHLQLYTEHTFAYEGHECVWRGWSPITPGEIRRLDGWCRAHGMTLAANQNCFGHLSEWLGHPDYSHLAETHGVYDFYGIERTGPFSLCPIDPRSAEFIDGLLGQLLPCFSSGLVNIGGDETADVGQGRSAEQVRRRGYAPVYFDFLDRVASSVRARGFRPMFWADIALGHREHAHRIPEDAVALAWHYEPGAPFSEWCDRLGELEREVWVCPGTSAWRSITGRTNERHGNLAAAAEGLDHGTSGLLVTEWGDLGHRQQWPISAHALAHAADTAWTGDASGFDARAAGVHALDDPTGEIGPWLEALGDVDLPIREAAGPPRPDGSRARLANASALFSELHPARPDHGQPGTVDAWRRVEERLAVLAETLPDGLPLLVRDELSHTLDVACFAARRAVLRRTGMTERQAARAELTDRLVGIIRDHRRLWLIRSRPGGLASSTGRYEALMPA